MLFCQVEFSIVFYLIRALHKFDSTPDISLTPNKWRPVASDRDLYCWRSQYRQSGRKVSQHIKCSLWLPYSSRLLKLKKILVLTRKGVATNVRPLADRKRQCHCSYEQNNDEMVGEKCHMFSFVFLELCHFAFKLTICFLCKLCLEIRDQHPRCQGQSFTPK